ncbi:MAG: DUF4372 domain-containing protein [Deltaproteobacteria bacterium]|nr:DUF4372 domain-containing protein [Deltaproteobacteria bacterium]
MMMFVQISTRCGLRDIVNQFRFQSRRLYHLGARAAVPVPDMEPAVSDGHARECDR